MNENTFPTPYPTSPETIIGLLRLYGPHGPYSTNPKTIWDLLRLYQPLGIESQAPITQNPNV